MKKKKWIFICFIVFAVAVTAVYFPAYALTAEEVEQQVAAQGKETVAGNVLIWFLCAVAFLKVSQKIDSFMSSLGVNVGRTGGSMLMDAMLAGRVLTGGMKAFTGFGNRGGGHRGSSSSAQESALSGGLAGAVGRMFADTAAENVTGQSDTVTSNMARAVYQESLKNGGDFANNVISKVATGSISQNGSIKGAEAEAAFSSYMGLNQGNHESHPSESNEQTGSPSMLGQDRMDYGIPAMETENSYDSENLDFGNPSFGYGEGITSAWDESMDTISDMVPDTQEFSCNPVPSTEQEMGMPSAIDSNIENGRIPDTQNFLDIPILTTEQAAGMPSPGYSNADNNHIPSSLNPLEQNGSSIPSGVEGFREAGNIVSTANESNTSFSENTNGSSAITSNETVHSNSGEEQSSWLPDSPIISEGINKADIESSQTGLPEEFHTESQGIQDEAIHLSGMSVGNIADSHNEGIPELAEGMSISDMPQENQMQTASPSDGTSPKIQTSFSDMELGGGRITGTEVSQAHPDGIRFAMYHTDQYARPEDAFNVVKAVDGSKWYHQYAKNAVIKEPRMGIDGKIIYNESIAKKLPPAPKRKDRM